MSDRVLVTGAVGFVGAHTCRYLLDRGNEVVGVDNFDAFYDRAIKEDALTELAGRKGFSFTEGDIRDSELMTRLLGGVDVVVHLAARPGVRTSIDDAERSFSVNTGGTVTVLEGCRKAGVRRFVFASSSSVYGENTPAPFREDAACGEPISPYAASKRAAELQCHVYAHLHGFRVAVLRLFTVYGPRQRPDLAIHRFTRLLAAGKPVPQFGDGSSERDYTWVDDTLQGLYGALQWTNQQEAASEVFNLGESQTVRLDRLIRLIGDALGVEPRIEVLPPARGDVRRTCADISKARRVLGYDPKVAIDEGIARFVRWAESH